MPPASQHSPGTPHAAAPRADRSLSSSPFYLLVAGAYAVLTVPRMAQTGMFLDGLIYASIARNLADGLGTFWQPYYTVFIPRFFEHPPLGFALQAVPFMLVGDHLAVERVYSVLAGALIAAGMTAIWRATIGEGRLGWLPLVFWLVPATVTWSIVNNMLETTQTAFTTWAVYAGVRSLSGGQRAGAWALASGLCVSAAVLTKGPTGLFPLAAPIIALLLWRTRAAVARTFAVMVFSVLGVFALLLILPQSSHALLTYWEQQVAASISGARGGGRFGDLFRHLRGVIVRMSIVFALAAAHGWWRQGGVGDTSGESRLREWLLFFVALALAASLPLAISGRVMGHYLVPALPLYALAFAAGTVYLWRPALEAAIARPVVRRTVACSGGVLVVLAILFPAVGVTLERRDVARVAALRSLAPSMPRHVTIGTCEAVAADWSLHAYAQRLFEVSLDTTGRPQQWYLQALDRPCSAPPACRAVSVSALLSLLACEGGEVP